MTRLVDTAQQLEGVARHASTHAAGVVISRDPLVDHVPLQRPNRGDETSDPDDAVRDGAGGEDRPAQDGLPRPGEPDHPRARRRAHPADATASTIDLDAPARRRPEDVRDARQGRDLRRLPAGIGRHAPRTSRSCGPTNIADLVRARRALPPGADAAHPALHAGRSTARRRSRTRTRTSPTSWTRPTASSSTRTRCCSIAQQFAGYTLAQADIMRKAMGKKIADDHAGRARALHHRRHGQGLQPGRRRARSST